MDEAELCDRIALITDGKILQINTPEAIIASFPKRIYKVRTANTYQLIEDLRIYPDTHSAYPFGEYMHFTPKSDSFKTVDLKGYLEARSQSDIEIIETTATIEDTFMDLARDNELVAE